MRLQHADIGLGAGNLRIGAGNRRLGLVDGGLRVVERRLAADLGLHQLSGAIGAAHRIGRPQLRRRSLRVRLQQRSLRGFSLRGDALQRLALGDDLRLGLRDRDRVVAVIHHDQRIAGLHVLVLTTGTVAT